jgi:hypothetical protein
VVALQALSEFTALTSGQHGAEQLSVSLSAGNFSYDFQTITPVNSLILQSVEVSHNQLLIFEVKIYFSVDCNLLQAR